MTRLSERIVGAIWSGLGTCAQSPNPQTLTNRRITCPLSDMSDSRQMIANRRPLACDVPIDRFNRLLQSTAQ